jgi:hypothetical protein
LHSSKVLGELTLDNFNVGVFFEGCNEIILNDAEISNFWRSPKIKGPLSPLEKDLIGQSKENNVLNDELKGANPWNKIMALMRA